MATWADKIRYRARWSATLHYVGAVGDHPSDTCIFPGDNGWAGREGANVLAAIRNVSGILDDFVGISSPGSGVQLSRTSDDLGLASEALKFLIHFIGDLHQPLHLTGRDRGGNSDKVSWDGRTTSELFYLFVLSFCTNPCTDLHSLWDGLLIAKALRTIPLNYTRPLPIPAIENNLRGAIYDPYIRKVMWEGIGVGMYGGGREGRWEEEVEGWLDCPISPSSSHAAQTAGVLSQLVQTVKQAFLSLAPRRGHQGPPQTTDDAIICPYAWAQPIHQLNCDLVWPKELDDPQYRDAAHANDVREDIDCRHASSADDEVRALNLDASSAPRRDNPGHYLELDTPKYAGRIEREWVVEKLLAQGGIRLAGVLNQIFAPLVEGGEDS